MGKTLSMKNTEINRVILNSIINILSSRALNKVKTELESEIMRALEEKKKSLKEIPARIIRKIFHPGAPTKSIAKISGLTLLDLMVLAEILGVEIHLRIGGD